MRPVCAEEGLHDVSQRGFSIVEAMVSAFIIAICVLIFTNAEALKWLKVGRTR